MYRQNTTSLDQAEYIHKDNLISSLRKQLNQLHDLEHQFIAVNDQITVVQSKQTILTDQIDRIQNQHKVKADINRQNISQLRNEIDHLKIQTHKCHVHIQDLLRQNGTLKRMCQNRQGQISVLMSGNQNIQKKNDEQIEQNKNCLLNIKKLKQDRNQFEFESERMQKQLQENIKELKILEKDARGLQSSIQRLSNILKLAQKDYSELKQQMISRQQWVTISNKKINQLNSQIDDLKDKSNKLQKDCQHNDNEFNKCFEDLQSMILNNKQINKNLKKLESQSRNIDNENDKCLLERQKYTNDHLELANQNKILNNQIDRCLLEIMQYEKINLQLQKEIQNYIKYDQQARQKLNRKDQIKNMLLIVSDKLHQTGQQISHLR